MSEDKQRLFLENLILLGSTGENSPADEAVVKEAIANDPELAALARDLECLEVTCARAPRDFAAEAIAEVYPMAAPMDFAARAITQLAKPRPRPVHYVRWAFAVAAAAVLLLLGVPSLFDRNPTPASQTRRTLVISTRLDAIESELISAKPSRFRHRL